MMTCLVGWLSRRILLMKLFETFAAKLFELNISQIGVNIKKVKILAEVTVS